MTFVVTKPFLEKGAGTRHKLVFTVRAYSRAEAVTLVVKRLVYG